MKLFSRYQRRNLDEWQALAEKVHFWDDTQKSDELVKEDF